MCRGSTVLPYICLIKALHSPRIPTVSEYRYRGIWSALLRTPIVDSERRPTATARRGLVGTLRFLNLEEEETVQTKSEKQYPANPGGAGHMTSWYECHSKKYENGPITSIEITITSVEVITGLPSP